jgi:hypothetical protein
VKKQLDFSGTPTGSVSGYGDVEDDDTSKRHEGEGSPSILISLWNIFKYDLPPPLSPYLRLCLMIDRAWCPSLLMWIGDRPPSTKIVIVAYSIVIHLWLWYLYNYCHV